MAVRMIKKYVHICFNVALVLPVLGLYYELIDQNYLKNQLIQKMISKYGLPLKNDVALRVRKIH